MDTSALIVTLVIITHCLGFFLITFNVIYLACTRGFDSARGYEKMFYCKQRNVKRRFKIRLDKALNLLVLYHITIIYMCVIMTIICEDVDSLNYQIDSLNDIVSMFWILAMFNYGVVFMLNVCYVIGIYSPHQWVFNRRSYVLGHLHQYNSFGFLNFLIFWTSVLLMLTCVGIDCRDIPQPWKDLARGLGFVSSGLSYVCMVVEAIYAEKRIILDGKVTSKQEALEIPERKLVETTLVEWVVECGEIDGRG